jgi:phenylacetic acid degradation operon negative regulatory protein
MSVRPLSGDSRWILWLLVTDLIEQAGETLGELRRRHSRPGRMNRHLKALETAGLVEHLGTEQGDDRLVRLTDAGRDSFWGTLDPEALWGRRWDGVWRMAMFDVPQARNALRVRMRRKLRDLRFGWLQNSVWVSPDPIADLLRALAAEEISVESLLFMEGRPAGGETDAELVAGAWDFEQLARLHATYLKFLETRPASPRVTKGGGWPVWLAAEERAWRAIVRHDPFLPAALLPRGYAGRTVWEARREILRTTAQALLES